MADFTLGPAKKVNSALIDILATDAATATDVLVLPEAYPSPQLWASEWNRVYFKELDRLKYENGLWPSRMPYPKPSGWGDVWGTSR
jgi:hypothetical protein